MSVRLDYGGRREVVSKRRRLATEQVWPKFARISDKQREMALRATGCATTPARRPQTDSAPVGRCAKPGQHFCRLGWPYSDTSIFFHRGRDFSRGVGIHLSRVYHRGKKCRDGGLWTLAQRRVSFPRRKLLRMLNCAPQPY